MNAALWISKTGLSAQDAEMSAIANNIANVNTTGFKRDRVMFQDLFYQTQEAPGAMLDQNNIMPTGLQFGSGVRIVGTQKTFTEGNVETTDNAMNVAIMGQGFLQVQKANGDIAYTRDGNLQVNADGVLTNSQGLPLQPEIDVPAGATNVAFGEDGTVTAILPGDSDATELGQLTLVNFANPAGLSAEGDNLYLETAASGQPTEGVPGEDGHFAGQRTGRLERGYRQRNGGDGYGATRVRDERQNGVGGGRYVAVHQPDAVRRNVGCDADALVGTISEWTVHVVWLINR